ncbi:hypothetical protein L7F22_007314 [Adiantum nelumboides]|nr:hypothetical protein [Adiantum nelumboides]
MAVSFLTFYGHYDKNARDFMDSLEMAHLMVGRDQEEVKLRAFPLVLKGEAHVWYDALAPPSKATWPTLYGTFLNKYGQGDTPENLWKQLLPHRQGSLGGYNPYESKFTNLWERWAASLQGQGGAPNFLKRDKFVEGMFPTLKEKVEAKFPQTFEEAQEIATVKFKKLLYQERKSNCVKEREEAPTRGQQPRDDARPLRRSTQELRCWNCNETGHRRLPQTVQFDVPQQPPTILRRPPPPPQPMAAVPPVPEQPEERGVNIIKLEEPEELNVMPAIKRTRAQERDEEMKSDTSDEPKKEKKKVKEDEAESSKKKKSRQPRRVIGIDDFPLDEDSSDESSYGDEESYTSEESSMEVMGLVFQQPQAKGSSTKVEVTAQEEPMLEERFKNILAKDLSKEEEEDYINMFKRYPHLFITDYSMIKGVDVIQHHIDLKPDVKPVAQKLRRLGVVQQEALLSEVNKLLKAGFIYPVTNSEWVSPVVVTPKKNGKWRVCVDYKPLNAATKRDHFPFPFQDEILNEVAGHERYTVCDGYSGYYQIRIAKKDQHKTTFITPWGCFAFRVMPFGLTNAPSTFTRFTSFIFQPFFGKSIRVFLDDFCTYSDRALHCQRVEEGLQRLYQYGGQLNPDKCHVAEKEVVLLGHVISQEGIKVDPSRVQAILDLLPPNSARQVITFVQKIRYMSRFIHLLSQIISSLQQLANQEVFSWEQEHLECFNEVKENKLEEGMLVMRYDSRLDLSHSKKFLQRWEGPYVIFKKFKNGSYRLQDLSGKIHKYPINGWRLKEFFQRIQPIKEERQVSLDA